MAKQVHRAIYIALLCGLAVSMTTSVFITNLLWVLLLANWVTEWNWKEKFAGFRHNYLLHAFLMMAGVHLVWLLGTHNLAYGLFDIQKKLPLFFIPLVALTTPPLSRRELSWVGISYVGTVLVVSVIGFIRYLTIPYLPYRNIVPHISHIRFGLNICLTLFIIAYALIRCRHRPWLHLVGAVAMLWLTAFLFLLHAYTSFIIIVVTLVILLIAFRHRLSRRLRITATLTVAAILAVVASFAGVYIHDYYHLQPLSTANPLPQLTENGNPYLHLHDGLTENGNYVHLYVCEKEMRQEWGKLSNHPFDSLTATGYTVYPTLLRYLGGMGLTKDSLGMTRLQPNDIAAIEKGIANPVYLRPGPRKLIYVLLYEYENYRCFRSVNNFSVLQRLELWRNAWQVYTQHPLLGVGTGDVVDQCHAQMQQNHSPLADTDLHTHSQYLNFLLAFGLVGFLLIVLPFIRAIHLRRLCYSPLFTAFLCILLISFISEDTLETLAGIMFAVIGTILPPKASVTTQ